MFIEKLSPREKIYFWTAVIIIVAALIYRFFFQSILDEFRNVDNETCLTEGKMRKSIYILSQSNRINKEYKQFGVYFREGEKVKSDEEEIARI